MGAGSAARMPGVAAGLLAAVALVACQSPAEPADGGAAAPPVALPACDAPPEPTPYGDVDGLVLPTGAVVTEVSRTGPVTQVRGYLPLTPVEVRQDYAQAGLTILLIEDEVYEAEVLLSDGANRLFVKALAVCDRGSDFVAVVGPQDQAAAIPVPSGSPSG